MAGIVRYGAYVPCWRLARSDISRAWGGRSEKGEKAVASHDEDSLSMAVEAARDCLAGWDREKIDGLFWVSTTAPYREKQGSAFIASVLGLRPDLITADLSHCLRSGLAAMDMASVYVSSGRASNILVVFSDMRTAHPGSPLEPWMGDGAAAFLVGNRGVGVEWGHFHCLSNEMHDVWRTDDDRFIRTWEDRWAKKYGLFDMTVQGIGQLLHRAGISAEQVDRGVLAAPDPRSHRELFKRIGVDYDGRAADPLLESVGAAGAAHVPMMLAHALESAVPGRTILVCAYGDGVEAAILRTTDGVEKARGARAVSGQVKRRRKLPNYERYLWYRRLVDVQPPDPLLVDSSATVLLRDRNEIYRLHGSRCRKCSQVVYPIQRICGRCRSKDDYDEIPLAESRGRLFTFTLDHLASQVDPPLIQSVVDMDAGGRIYTSMTDAGPDEVEMGMEVEMTFRRTRKAAGFYNYFWKCRPADPAER